MNCGDNRNLALFLLSLAVSDIIGEFYCLQMLLISSYFTSLTDRSHVPHSLDISVSGKLGLNVLRLSACFSVADVTLLDPIFIGTSLVSW